MYRQRVTVRNGLREEVASDSIWSVHKVWMEGSGNLIQRERERERLSGIKCMSRVSDVDF